MLGWNWSGKEEFCPELAREFKSSHTPPRGLGFVSCLTGTGTGCEADLVCECVSLPDVGLPYPSWLAEDEGACLRGI